MTCNVYDEVTEFMGSDIFTSNNWYYIKQYDTHDYKHLILTRKYYELDRIEIEFKNNIIHFSLPLKHSKYSFYKKFNHNNHNNHNVISFFKIYMNDFMNSNL
jgi:hypothetical protein